MTDEKRPKMKTSEAEKELDRITEASKDFEQQIKEINLDVLQAAPKKEVEPQTKLAQSEIEKSDEVYLKPRRSIGAREKFNEKYREDYNFAIEYVKFIAENKECIGELIEMWTKPFAGMPCQEWAIPVNKPVWAPRHVAERLRSCTYRRLIMDEEKVVGNSRAGQMTGQLIVESTVNRLDANPVSSKKSIFMGSANF
ncbi:hypothetical protein UFOVP1357_3 [uncultured Caudovirales phage]|uniref:Uncharacterized protein n=1 Tax=uncultured Caudovirales phage TaxID=2100421 RepID=A0A6J5S0I6_9CAUD|nr:hypothetical protein UFOVP18_11 [uncultured Caudovirales phage]CAB4126662.1 hypothetical protein UFOVP82_13 [uncultured Caudovirales phage]CAB4132321.1 hypothetical protein UFOVP258_4 [uncultured Caudovirales phage]CAB4146655.1 hypothetical protein UFOVP502_54 [uncultured Caudovirales phage]CAB4199628.1 hypothetical protein UFOVP1357_3 [uncultured Caudovirales phage]